MMLASTTFPTPAPRRNLARIYWLEARAEVLKSLRLPAYSLPTIGFPLMFYLLFGIAFGAGRPAGPVNIATYLLATYGAFGVIGAALFGFGIGVAVERGQGWMLLKRASPMPPEAYFAAKITMSLLFSVAIVACLFTLGAAFGKVEMAASSWLLLGGTLVAGALPFCAMGLALGYLAGPNSAPAVVNMIYLPMGFLSGLWFPVHMLPKVIQGLAPWLPAYHVGQLALKVIGADRGQPVELHLGYLALFTTICLALARLGYRRDEDRTFG